MRKTANLAARKDNYRNLEETFTYDNLNRLTDVWLNNVHTGHMAYDALGRMTDKRTDGQNVFSAAQHDYVGPDGQLRPHAISSATVEGNPFPTTQQSITYTMFDKVKTITQGNRVLSYEYGYDHQRIKMEETLNGTTVTEKDYFGNCEIVHKNGNVPYTYLSGPLGTFAVVRRIMNFDQISFILKDHLGSWTTITDYDGSLEQELSFDAWGNLRDPETWSGEFDETPLLDRGFTGHEHLYNFGLINMNGRMYDPVMSSFLSVDNYVQQPDNSQNFNRYAYCLNNPLKYTDPSGELFGIDDIMFSMIVYGISSVVINGVVNTCAGRNFYDGSYGAFMGGITSVAVGGVMGGVTARILKETGGFLWGGIAQGTGGLFGGYAGGAMGAWCNGGSLRDCMIAGLSGGAIGLGTGFVHGGIQGGIYAKMNSGNFWTGDGIIHKQLSPLPKSNKVGIGEGMEYTPEYVENMKKTCYFDEALKTINKSVRNTYVNMEIPPNSSFKVSGDLMLDFSTLDEEGNPAVVDGAAVYHAKTHKSDLYFYKTAFTSREKLYLTMTHEYIHAGFNYFQKNSVGRDFQHAAIYQWQSEQATIWEMSEASKWLEYAEIYSKAGYYRKSIYNGIREMGFELWTIKGIRPWD